MKYGDTFKEQLRGGEHLRPEKNTPKKVSNTPNEKQDKASRDVKSKKKVMAGKMDKYMTNMCKFCGKKHMGEC